jgi:hypothetical protein
MEDKMNLTVLQQELIKSLNGSQSHIPCINIIQEFPVEMINSRIDEVPYSPWELFEHMRLTQFDILDYIRNPDYKESKWPDAYWPQKGETASADKWHNSVKLFIEDLKAMEEIVKNPKTDLTAPLAHNPDHTIFREILIVGNHNSYHCGQLLIFKRALKIY